MSFNNNNIIFLYITIRHIKIVIHDTMSYYIKFKYRHIETLLGIKMFKYQTLFWVCLWVA